MSLASIIRSAVAVTKRITTAGEVLEPVTLTRWVGVDTSGDPDYDTAETYDALVELGADHIYDDKGEQVPVIARVTILEPLADNGADDRLEPLDPRDVITLPDGSSGPIVKKPPGLVDGGSGSPYMSEVWIGR